MPVEEVPDPRLGLLLLAPPLRTLALGLLTRLQLLPGLRLRRVAAAQQVLHRARPDRLDPGHAHAHSPPCRSARVRARRPGPPGKIIDSCVCGVLVEYLRLAGETDSRRKQQDDQRGGREGRSETEATEKDQRSTGSEGGERSSKIKRRERGDERARKRSTRGRRTRRRGRDRREGVRSRSRQRPSGASGHLPALRGRGAKPHGARGTVALAAGSRRRQGRARRRRPARASTHNRITMHASAEDGGEHREPLRCPSETGGWHPGPSQRAAPSRAPPARPRREGARRGSGSGRGRTTRAARARPGGHHARWPRWPAPGCRNPRGQRPTGWPPRGARWPLASRRWPPCGVTQRPWPPP